MICMRELATIGVATIRYKSVDKDTNRKRESYTIGTYDQGHYCDHFHGGTQTHVKSIVQFLGQIRSKICVRVDEGITYLM